MPTAEWIFEHSFPTSVIWLALVVMLAGVAAVGWRYLPRNLVGFMLIGLRYLFIFLLVWVLFLPGRKSAITEIIKPRFVVLLDKSASMTQMFGEGVNQPRWSTAQNFLKEKWATSLRSRCMVDVYPFHTDLDFPVTLDDVHAVVADGKSTHLNLSLNRLFERLRGQQIAGILLLSDGVDTREKKELWSETSWPAPIYVAELEAPGIPDNTPDMRVESMDTQRRTVVGWDTALTATIAGQGGKGEPFPVLLLKNGKEIDKVAVQLPPEGGSRELQFKLTHEAVGSEQYVLRIPALISEVQTNDNEMVVSVDVLDAKNRVMFVEDTPRFESKYLSRALFANKDITPLAGFKIASEQSFIAYGDRQGMTFELTPEQLRLNKIVIIGDFEADALAPYSATLLEYVEKGGSLILLGGQRLWGANGIAKTDLAKLLPFTREGAPAQEGKFNVEWTAEGRAHPALANNPDMPATLPPVLSVFTGAKLTGGAFALAEAITEKAGNQPILVSRVYGQGKVLAVLTDSLFRWNMQPGNEKPYPKFWRQIIQWMSPASGDMDQYYMELFSDAGSIAVGDPAILQGRLVVPSSDVRKNWKVTCEVTTPSDRKIPLAMVGKNIQAAGSEIPGYVTEFTPSEPGNYKAVATVDVDGKKVTSAPCLFSVRATSQELVLKPINDKVLKNIARFSGGRYGKVSEITADLENLRVNERRERKLEYRSLWQSSVILCLLVTLLSIEWVLRKMNSLS